MSLTGIIDYGAGNLRSVKNALDYLGLQSVISSDRETLAACDRLILPGVGAFKAAMQKLERAGLILFVREEAEKKPFLGICLGMQLLFEEGYEFGFSKGLGLLPGKVDRIDAGGLKIPHMGWNGLRIKRPDSPLLKGICEDDYVYFVHSYCAKCAPEVVSADCFYGEAVPALVERGHIFGAQFHPEKSSAVGLRILKNFGEVRI